MKFIPRQTGTFGKISFSFPIQVGVTGFAISCFFACCYHFGREYRETMTFFATCVGGTAAIVGTFYAGQALRENSREKRIDRALPYIEKWSDPSFDSIRKAGIEVNHKLREAQKVNKSINDVNFIINLIQSDAQLKMNVCNAFNFFETIANSIELGIADEATLFNFYRSIMLSHNRLFAGWILSIRNQPNDPNSEIFRAYTDLCDKWSLRSNPEMAAAK